MLTEVIAVAVVVLVVLYIFIRLHSVTVYRFYKPSCPHCVNSQAEWDNFKSKCMWKLIRPVDVNLENKGNQKMAAKFQVKTVPKVVKVDTKGVITEYPGNEIGRASCRERVSSPV